MRLGLKVWRRLILGLALAFGAGAALAETDFPVIGGSGNNPFEDRCPGGEYLLGFNAQMGASMNMVQIVCTAVQQTAIPGQDTRIGPLYEGPLRGGRAGGGPVVGFCDNGQVLTGMMPDMTASGGTIKDVRLWCGDGFGNHVPRNLLVSPNDNPYVDQYKGNAPPTVMWCPTGEAGIGVRGREGLDINAISLICGAFTALAATAPASTPPPPPPTSAGPAAPVGIATMPGGANLMSPMMPGQPAQPPTTAHVASNTGDPIKITGRATGAPPPPATPRPVSLFNGFWRVTPSQGGPFTLDLMLVSGSSMGGAIMQSDNPSDKGSMSGRQIDETHAELKFTQPADNRTGTIDVTATGDGDTFTGLGQTTDGQSLTWQATKTTPPAPAAAH